MYMQTFKIIETQISFLEMIRICNTTKLTYLIIDFFQALYIDAAIYIPAELPQIQDLIIEKQLRLHVTPEELDVLRNQKKILVKMICDIYVKLINNTMLL